MANGFSLRECPLAKFSLHCLSLELLGQREDARCFERTMDDHSLTSRSWPFHVVCRVS